jgi:hypothetical protein
MSPAPRPAGGASRPRTGSFLMEDPEGASAPEVPTADWRTPAELDDYRTTPNYADTVTYLERVAAAFPKTVRIESFGRTGEGRDLKIVIVSQGSLFDPEAIHAAGRVLLLVQNSIHAGEMDGKDACLALLRDLVRPGGPADLLEKVVLVFIPVYNIDGHERRSPYNRINQNGPAQAGWRANGRNLNLNRDYMKADAPETRAFLRMFHRWLPDFFVDNHVTDGADFQYDVTFALDDGPDVPSAMGRWIRERVRPELTRRVNASGHLAFPSQIFLTDETDPTRGLVSHDNPPRFSTGRMILENRPGLLVELHMLKDYRTRVTADYELLRGLMGVLNQEASTLTALNRAADHEATELGTQRTDVGPFPLCLGKSGQSEPVEFRGYEFERTVSDISGAPAIRYTSRPWNVTLPIETGATVDVAVPLPVGYIIPPAWVHVIDVLEAHGVLVERTRAPWTGPVERYHCSGMVWPDRPFEGRRPILRGGNVERTFGAFGQCELQLETVTFDAGSVVVPLSQRLAKVAVHWLEPAAPDSALRWGFFDPTFEQKESGDAYVLEKLARDVLPTDPALRAEFEHRLQADPEFARDPSARLEFFFDRSPWGRANRIGEYPVGRLLSMDGLPLA